MELGLAARVDLFVVDMPCNALMLVANALRPGEHCYTGCMLIFVHTAAIAR